jgi:hypothetical protein
MLVGLFNRYLWVWPNDANRHFGDRAMTSRAATSKISRTNAKIVEAVIRHAVGGSQKPAIIGPLEVTEDGLVLHLTADLFGKPATKTSRK